MWNRTQSEALIYSTVANCWNLNSYVNKLRKYSYLIYLSSCERVRRQFNQLLD